MSRGWNFSLGGRKFELLPDPQNLSDNSSDDSPTPDQSGRSRSLYVPTMMKRGAANPETSISSHSQLMAQNFSTYSPTTKPAGATTMESLHVESQKLALKEASARVEMLTEQRDDLATELRRIKADNRRKLVDMRARIEETAQKMERTAGVLRAEIMEQTKKLDDRRAKQEADERFVAMRQKRERISEATRSFADCQESIASLATVMQFSPLAESEFDVIVNTGTFDSMLGRAVMEFVDAAKSVLVKKEMTCD